MSNYRRLISYIYAYEGGVKGKNIGFAKLETRNGQCRIQVSVRKVFLGNQDMGVYLLSTGSEIFLGRIFLRNGAGEFRTSVAVEHVAGSDQNIDQCYGLTIHNIDDSWQNYTTIWEDAVAHAAEVELEEAVSELAEEKEMSHIPESVLSEKKLEEVAANHKSSIIENIEAEIQAQSQQENTDTSAGETSAQDMGEEIPSTFVQPRKEEPQKILWPKEDEQQSTEKASDTQQPAQEKQPQMQERYEEQHQEVQSKEHPELSPQQQLEKELNEEVLETPQIKPESQGTQEREAQKQLEEENQEQPQLQSAERTAPQGESQTQIQPQPVQRTRSQQRVQSQMYPRQQLFQGYFSRRPIHGMPQQEQYYQEMPVQQRTERQTRQRMPAQGVMPPQTAALSYSMEAAGMMQPAVQEPQQSPTPSQQPVSSQPQTPSQPTMASQQPTVPPQQPTMPSQQPTVPSQQPTMPSQQPTVPSQQPTMPSQQPQVPPQQQPMMQPSNWEQQQEPLEKEDAKEGVDMETLWKRFCRTYPKIQAFDYDGNSEILTIKPQDIGLLPREIWTYGNNSFLLHGYYNHRYLILARLATQNGGVRFLLGVPGHYYSNEKYMAAMFGFPNFVMSKAQPSGDNRFGYWYTDLRLGF